MNTPVKCHLWQMDSLIPQDLYGCFETVEQFADDGHDRRALLKCKKCGQLYFYEFHEWIDWEGGNDPQYRTYIPVDTEEEVQTLLGTNPFTLLSFAPRLQTDFPKDASAPKVYWVRT
jgi:hypothetical protein